MIILRWSRTTKSDCQAAEFRKALISVSPVGSVQWILSQDALKRRGETRWTPGPGTPAPGVRGVILGSAWRAGMAPGGKRRVIKTVRAGGPGALLWSRPARHCHC